MRQSIFFHLKSLLVLLVYCLVLQDIEARSNKKAPVILDEDSWTQLLEGEWMVDFYAPWCPACKKLEPEWKKFSEWSEELNIKVASADVTANPGLTGRFMISGLPTIYHVKDGIFRIYSGPREVASLINFIEEQGWKAVQPGSRWWAPNTLQMSLLAHSFRISMALRDVHNYLVEDVGLPYYISYLIFALCTVTLGTILGLIIVFVIDQFCPSRYSSAAQVAASRSATVKDKKKDKVNDSDLDDTIPETKSGASKSRKKKDQ